MWLYTPNRVKIADVKMAKYEKGQRLEAVSGCLSTYLSRGPKDQEGGFKLRRLSVHSA
jgi:hypothetical protein